MRFTLFEGGPHFMRCYLVIENETECWIFYKNLFLDYVTFVGNKIHYYELACMNSRSISDKEAIHMLIEHANLRSVREFLNRYAVLPF